MDMVRDESSVILLSVNGKPTPEAENNNMVETTSFHPFDYDISSGTEEKKIKRRTRIPHVIAWVCIGCVMVSAIAAIILLVKYTAFNGETGSTNQNMSSSTSTVPSFSSMSPTPTVSLETTTSYSSSIRSTPSVSPSFTSTTSFKSSTSLPSVSSSSSKTVPSVSSASIKTATETIKSSHSSSAVTATSVIMTSLSIIVTKTSDIPSTVLYTTTVQSTSVISTSSSATVVITTPLPACKPEQFQCSDGSCIDEKLVCNGKPECPGGDDEASDCECSADQFRCGSGQCIQDKFRCDGVTQCYDRSDEVNCTNCSGFKCASGQCLWTHSVWCNYKVDCLDLSDELNCEGRLSGYECKNGMKVKWGKLCDGVDDCYDNSDELNCTVPSDMDCLFAGKKPCQDSSNTCVIPEWWCDGVTDCPAGGDEAACGKCRSDQFQCTDYTCIDKTLVCDGVTQCSLGEDEVECIQLDATHNSSILVKSHGLHLPVCSAVWSHNVGDEICHHLGLGPSSGHKFVTLATAGVTGTQDFMVLEYTGSVLTENQTVLSRLTQRSTCSSQKVVSLTCQPKGCGARQVDIMTPFIFGGILSSLGKWPWMVSLSLLGRDVCGGVLIDKRWVLTAGHCVVTSTANYTSTPHLFQVTLGTISRQRKPNDNAQHITVDRIITHPEMLRQVTGVTEWDMALLHLSRPVVYGVYIQPVCLPGEGEEFPTSSICYLAGWGYINPQQISVNNLREAKMRLWGEKDCRGNFVAGETGVNTNATLCAGYTSGLISGCQGDSGGPLMCSDSMGHWTVAGLMSSGADGCNGQSSKANRFAKVSSAINWIHNVMQMR